MDETEARHLANLMGMAGTAETAGNNEEALAYYNRVLEADPTCSAAWHGKGRVAGGLSSLSALRVRETIVYFGHAIATATEPEKPSLAELLSAEFDLLATRLATAAANHLAQFPTVASAQKSYVMVNAQLIDALVEAQAWTPFNRALHEKTVTLARYLLNHGVAEPLLSVLKERMAASNAAILAHDPTYVAPELASVTSRERQAATAAHAQQAAEANANWNAIGYIVLFVVILIATIMGVAVPHHHRYYH